ncbi:MAG: hypothetical protein AB7K71_04670 [Polyangiaceae bacterium]
MKLRTSLVLTGLSLSLCVACVDSTCDDTNSCPHGTAGAAGSGGTAGTSGSGGTSGGTGGTAGNGGSAGSGGSAGAGATGGTAGAAGSGGTGPQCDPTSLPGDDACVIDDEYGVFVSPSGSDSNGGTMAAPFATVGKGLQEAKAAGKRLYVCADGGSFAETVSLSAANAGISAWGSFKCADWTYDGSLKARVAPTSEGYALTADSVNSATLLDGFEFESQSATQAGGSSVAAFVKTSSALTLSHVKLVAGSGMKGADGVRSDYTQPSGVDGGDATVATGGTGTEYTQCPGGGTTKGGDGGPLSFGGASGTRSPGTTPANAGVGGAVCGSGGLGGLGEPGLEGTAGTASSALGTLDGTGWIPADSGAGTPGTIGQGGGGGRGGTSGGGGGGGAGGCGGSPGGGGKGGGASIALLLVNSPITLTDSELVSGAAGAGGKGSDGQEGLIAGLGGRRAGTAGTSGCDGGDGGQGGPGGGGAGGPGGVSAGILHLGTAPTVTGGSITSGTAGAAGVGGKAGASGSKAADGLPGVAEQIREVTN